mmetsp:Transcript_6985/g.9450  ORF Transcript_6985/g.9450 Transcript_6985/m.9450 type:complete len:95 (-) Transcript_6985:1253-1537(-)
MVRETTRVLGVHEVAAAHDPEAQNQSAAAAVMPQLFQTCMCILNIKLSCYQEAFALLVHYFTQVRVVSFVQFALGVQLSGILKPPGLSEHFDSI